MFEIVEFAGSSGKGANEGPRLLITGGIHGDEFEPVAAIQRLISRFFEGADGQIAGTLTLIPVVNEAAFRRGHRVAAEDEKDLARTFPGSEHGTLTEQVAHKLAGFIREADFYIDLHTGGTELAVFPLAGYMMVENEDVLESQRRMANAMGLPFIWGTAADLDGRSMSVARDAGVPAIYAEFLGSATCAEAGIDAYFSGCLNVMAELGMLPGIEAAPSPAGLEIVEDPSPGSGHMQVSHPAPCEGFFHRNTEIGDRVSEGDLLGEITDFTGRVSVPVKAARSGRVIVLRTFPRVKAGDPIAVIA